MLSSFGLVGVIFDLFGYAAKAVTHGITLWGLSQ